MVLIFSSLSFAATGSTRLPSYSSPPNTPSGTPSSYESEGDSGHPSSPDSNSVSLLLCIIFILS